MREARRHQQIQHEGAQHLPCHVIRTGEGDAGVALHLAEAPEVFALVGLLLGIEGVTRIPWGPSGAGMAMNSLRPCSSASHASHWV
ncbi:MAG: hypothetical protein VKI81_00325 [Synechococcaceae cyanobacterium]|nr:hypothetical protein [Synechococcaceae cyanobacterium]